MTRFTLILFSMALTAVGDSDADATAKDLEKMQGDWAVVSVIRDGVKEEDDNAQSLFRTVKGHQYTVFLFDKAVGNGTFQIDATKKPKTIESFPANLAGKTLLGIYLIDGDTIKTCYAPPGKDRPTEFSSKKGSGHTLMVWERERKK
jgi:uncharacterized protein (TIGR03067 family)